MRTTASENLSGEAILIFRRCFKVAAFQKAHMPESLFNKVADL